MNGPKWRIPHRVKFPFGYSIQVVQLPSGEFEDKDQGEGNDAFWFPTDKTIYIRKSAGIRWKRYLLAHELGHAREDWIHELVLSGFAAPKGDKR